VNQSHLCLIGHWKKDKCAWGDPALAGVAILVPNKEVDHVVGRLRVLRPLKDRPKRD
jgi:hypothetical protein